MILITGATGFIGKYVVDKLLSDEQELLLIVKNKNKYEVKLNEIVIEGNLQFVDCLAEQLKQYRIDTCVHLAWEGIPDYSFEMSRKNINYGMNVLCLCRILKIKHLIITGSCWEYENPIGCISTNYKLGSENSFKAAKNALYMIAHSFCRENGIILNWMRLFYVYGPGQREGSLIPYVIKCFREDMRPKLNGIYNRNDFIYVRDVADAIAKVSQTTMYPELLNCGSGYSSEVLEVVRIIARNMKKDFDETLYEKSGNELDFYADAEEMFRDYGWKNSIDLDYGIQLMLM